MYQSGRAGDEAKKRNAPINVNPVGGGGGRAGTGWGFDEF